MPAIVTKDVQDARALIKGGSKNAAETKREAHRRQRAHVRNRIRREDYDADMRGRPGTGWDVA